MSERALVLLAEDNEDHVLLIRRAFKRAGLLNPLHVVSNGEEAIEYLAGVGAYANRAEYPLPTLLLLDLKMPRKDGFQVLDWIRSHPGMQRLRVVVLTTSSDLRDVNVAYRMGANSFLVKPDDFDKIVSLVQIFKQYWLAADKAPDVSRSIEEEPWPPRLNPKLGGNEMKSPEGTD